MATGRAVVALGAVAALGVLAWRAKEKRRMHAEDALQAAFAASAPGDWKYIAEGALNLALSYKGDSAALRGFVLRVRKDNPEASGGKSEANPWDESLRFVEKLVVPLLGRRYVQPAVQVPLSAAFMQELGRNIEADRPVKRRKHPLDPNLRTGLLMLDNTAIPVGEGPSICFELKIKCGFVPSDCPFVTHDVKRRVDRFTMHQQLKNSQGKLDTVSRYSPLDLFSYEEARVRRALEALMETPQNNFRMFVDGEMVYPDAKGHGGRDKFAAVLARFPGIRGGVDGLLDTLGAVLAREPLLKRVKTMQMMDDCDIEGVLPAYEAIVARGESVLPLADGETIYPRAPPTATPASPEEQHEAVRRFMLACTAKDCSTMIVLKPSDSAPDAEAKRSPLDLPVQTSAPRTVVDGFHGYMYSIAVVDLDPKPIEKMKHYHKLDKQVAEFYAAKEQEGALL